MQAPDWLSDMAPGTAIAVVSALAGRLLYHTEEVKQGRRRFFSPNLLWEVPTAIGMGLVGDALATHFGLTGRVAVGAIAGISYIGPRLIEALFSAAQSRLAGVPEPKENDDRTP